MTKTKLVLMLETILKGCKHRVDFCNGSSEVIVVLSFGDIYTSHTFPLAMYYNAFVTEKDVVQRIVSDLRRMVEREDRDAAFKMQAMALAARLEGQ